MYAEPCEEYCILWCLVEGDCNPFKVTPSLDFDIDDLKKIIHAECIDATTWSVLPKDLVLWKLTESEPFEPDDTFARRVCEKCSNFSEVATELYPWTKLSTLFPQHPPQDRLHIIVQMSLNTDSQSPRTADSNDCPSERPPGSDMLLDKESLSHAREVFHPAVLFTEYHSEPHQLRLNCLAYCNDVKRTFIVRIEASQTVADLKDVIMEKNKDAFQHVDAIMLNLWKVSLAIDNNSWEHVSMPDGEPLSPITILSSIFPEPLHLEHIHIIVKPAFVAADAGDDAGPWLTEVYANIWKGGDQCLKKIVHKATVTVAHYRELQRRLSNRDSDKDIPTIKREILLDYKSNHNTPGNGQIPANVNEENGDDDLELGLNSNTSGNNQVPENVNEESGDDDPELGSFLPATFEFLDLSSLNLKHKLSRLPLPLFIRPEYSMIYEDIRCKEVNGNSYMVGSQPGTGKTAFLHYMMIKYMIIGRPFLYQSICGNVYHVSSDGVKIVKSWKPRINIVAFVDAMNSENILKSFLRLSCVQFILPSSPKGQNQKWMEQIGSTIFERIMDLWTPSEFYITGIFLHPHHLDFAHLRESTLYFGFNPQRSFNACKSWLGRDHHQARIIDAIKSIGPRDVSLYELMTETTTGTSNVSHVVFEILPLNEKRYFSQAQVRAVSPWVLEQLLEHYEQCDANAAVDFYNRTMRDPVPLRREIFQLRVLKYFDNINRPITFTIHNLATSESLDWIYPGPAHRKIFQSQSLTTVFKEFVEKKEARHLVPLIPNFGVDSILYDPTSVLTGFQITINQHQPIPVSGFQLIQQSLERNTELDGLQPEMTRRWRLIFVVPESMAANFPMQKFEGDTAGYWTQWVDQYALGLEEDKVWRTYT